MLTARDSAVPGSLPLGGNRGTGIPVVPLTRLYADVAGLLDGTIPEPPRPGLLYRSDGIGLFYRAQVNMLFGEAGDGKTLLAECATAAVLEAGGRVVLIDLDHNGVEATVVRLLDMGAPESVLRDLDRFRYVEPDDRLHLDAVVENATLHDWCPDLAVVDSVGELMPLFGLSSNSPDDFTHAHARVLKPLAKAGAAVVAIDHLPKNTEAKASGPTGTAAKRRAIGGAAIRVAAKEPFTPGTGGSAWLTLNKDRHGGLRQHCQIEGSREPVVGLFTLTSTDEEISYAVRAPELGDAAKAEQVSADDLAALDALEPAPSSVADVAARLRWRKQRAATVYRHWRRGGSPSVPGTAEPHRGPEPERLHARHGR